MQKRSFRGSGEPAWVSAVECGEKEDWGTKTANPLGADLQYSQLTDERVSLGVSYRFGNGPIVAKY